MDEIAKNYEVVADKNVTSPGVSILVTGTYPTRKGVILVTNEKYKGIIPLGHAAIIFNYNTIVHSVENGVVEGNNNWNKKTADVWVTTVKGTTTAQDALAADYCFQQKSKPYNYAFASIDRDDAFYCSRLVYMAFKVKCNINLNTSQYDGSPTSKSIHPYELRDGPNVSVIYNKS